MMKFVVFILLLAIFSVGNAQNVTITKWQDLQPYIAAQTAKLNQHTEQIGALTNRVQALELEVATLKTRMNVMENAYNITVYYGLAQLCFANSMQSSWVNALTGLKPFPLADLTCPPAGEKIYVPYFIGGQAAVLKPPQQ